MSVFQWVQSIGVGVTVLAALGALGYFRALNILVQAQLHPNGGGSIVDLVKLIPVLREAINELRDRVIANHEQGQADLQGLHAEDKAIESRLAGIEQKAEVLQVAADGLQRMADDLSVRLPEALGVQDKLVRDVHSLAERMDRVEAELFRD